MSGINFKGSSNGIAILGGINGITIDTVTKVIQLGFATARLQGQILKGFRLEKNTLLSLSSVNFSGAFMTNNAGSGVNYTLPVAPNVGDTFTFICEFPQFIIVSAAGSGNTIQVGALLTAVNGNVRSNVQGDSLKLVYVAAGKWMSESFFGGWF